MLEITASPYRMSFADNLEPGTEFLVMPQLRCCTDPSFATIEEVLDFVHQTLEVCHTDLR